MPNETELSEKNNTKSFSKLLDDFQSECDDVLEDYIVNGYLRTFAGILSYMSHDRAQKVLLSLNQDQRQKIDYFMAHDMCRPNFEAESVFASMGFAPLKQLVEIERQRRREGMETDATFAEFEGRNPIFAGYLKKMHFSFCEILLLDDRAVQRILREVDSNDLAKALKTCDEEIQNKIFRNMSQRAVAMLKEEIEFMGPIRLEDSYQSQQKICSVLLRMEANGDILRPNIDEGVQIVQAEIVRLIENG